MEKFSPPILGNYLYRGIHVLLLVTGPLNQLIPYFKIRFMTNELVETNFLIHA